MQEINEAYAVLGDSKRRTLYDALYSKEAGETEQDQMFVALWQEWRQEDEEHRRRDESGKAADQRWNEEQQKLFERGWRIPRIWLPKEDIYLLSALVRLGRDKLPQTAEVRNQKGEVIWHISYDPSLHDEDRKPRIEPALATSAPAEGRDRYTSGIWFVARFLAEPTQQRFDYCIALGIEPIQQYLKENKLMRKAKEYTLGTVLDGLDEGRITMFPVDHEGKPPIV